MRSVRDASSWRPAEGRRRRAAPQRSGLVGTFDPGRTDAVHPHACSAMRSSCRLSPLCTHSGAGSVERTCPRVDNGHLPDSNLHPGVLFGRASAGRCRRGRGPPDDMTARNGRNPFVCKGSRPVEPERRIELLTCSLREAVRVSSLCGPVQSSPEFRGFRSTTSAEKDPVSRRGLARDERRARPRLSTALHHRPSR